MANAFYAPMAKATQYAAPDISKLLYEGIGNLPQDYYQGQKSAQELAVSNMLSSQGLAPYWGADAKGKAQFNTYQYMNDLAKRGGPGAVNQFINSMMGMQYGSQQAKQAADIAGINTPPPEMPAGWGPPGQSQPPQPPPRSPPQTAGPQSNVNPSAPGPQSSTAQPPEPTGGMDYLAGMATEHYGSDIPAEGAINKVASALGVTPAQTLSPQQIQRASQLFASLSPDGRVQIRPAGSRPDTDPASGPQATFGPSEESAGAPRTYSPGVSGTPGPAPEAPVGGPGPGVVTLQGITPNRVSATTITPAGANVRTAGGPLGRPVTTPPAPTAQPTGQVPPLLTIPLPSNAPPELESLRRRAAAEAITAMTSGYNPDARMGAAGEKAASTLASQLMDTYKTKLQEFYKYNEPTPEMRAALSGAGPAIAEQKGREKFAEEQGKEDVAEAKAIRSAGKTARTDLDYLRDASIKMDDKDFYSGPFQDFVKHFKTGEWLIGGQRDKLTPMEMVRKEFANNEMAVIRDLGNSGLGRILYREVEAAQKTVAGMGLSVETNRAMVEMAIRLRERAVAIEDHLNQTGRPDYAWVAQYMNEHPLITPTERQNPKLIAPPHISKHEDFERLGVQPGEPFRAQDKDGTWRIVIRPRNQQ